jgi:tetratricopeptide (TPR) repeat protein
MNVILLRPNKLRRFAALAALLWISSAVPAFGRMADPTGASMAFLNANRLYADGDYGGAAEAYRSIVESGVRDPAVYYNLANTYHKLGRTAEAILYYERAKRLAPRDRDIQLNLEIAGMAAVDEIEPLPRNLLFRLADRPRESLSLNEKAALAVAGYVLLFLGLHLLLFDSGRRRRRVWTVAAWTGTAAIIFFGSLTVFQVVGERTHPRAVAMEEAVKVRAEPDREGEEIFTIHAGTGAVVEEGRGEWIEIRLDDGKYGWVPRRTVAYIP